MFKNILITILVVLVIMLGVYKYVPVKWLDTSPGLSFGTSITTIAGTDTLSASRSVINTNFSNLNSGKIEVGTTSVASITTLENLVLSALSSLTVTNSSTTLGSFSTGLWMPTSASQSPTTAGSIAHDSTSNQIKYGTGTATSVLGNGNIYPSFTYATSTAWNATTTIPLGTAFVAETWNGVQCFTDIGTLNVSFYDGTNRMNMFNASTTRGTVLFTTNNTFTAAETRYVDVGTPATAPKKISCTISKSITAD